MSPVALEVSRFADILWVVRDKDKSARIAALLGHEVTTIPGSARGMAGTGFEFLKNTFRCLSLTRRLGIDLWVTKYGCGNMAGRLLGRRSLAFNDDDADQVPVIAATSYPFADLILAPRRTRMGRFENKTIHYDSFHELFYLHPNRFVPDESVFGELGIEQGTPYVIVRISAMRAHHDSGAEGIDDVLVEDIIRTTGTRARLFISCEGRPPGAAAAHTISLREDRIHHALAFASVVISGGQTMAAEAAQLGTPTIHVNSFAHRLSYLEELVEMGLLESYRPGQKEAVLGRLGEMLASPCCGGDRAARRSSLLSRKEDPVPLFVDSARKLVLR